ncbi:MAG: HicB family protein [Clostridiales bacterium]|jgi:predicted RNase H-like HicB family nuclease|nr:HicB family protein [Clostridiales bacterium]
MKAAYPIVVSKGTTHLVVFIPDFNINTQGTDYANAMEMARDAIGLMGIDLEDDHEPLPQPSELSDVTKEYPGQVVTLVDVNFTEYRRKNELRTVRRNVSIPSWLNEKADQAGLNVSAVLQVALKKELHLTE